MAPRTRGTTNSILTLLAAIGLAVTSSTSSFARAQAESGVVSGVVMSDDAPAQPVRRATVRLVSGDLRVPLSTVTDDSGRFTFASVPAGHYGVVASKPAHVGAFYGSKRPGRGPGVPVAVPAGGRVTDLRITLTRGGVIAGSLRLPSGQPALNMPIVVVEIETVNGVRRLRLAGGRTTTDDRGEYRVFGLPPGQYIVQAQPSGLLTGALTAANDAPQTTAAEVSWAQQIARRRAGEGATATAASATEPARGRTMNYAVVYFPGTTDPSAASVVQVGPGEERRGVDFALALVATAKVSGVVLAPDGQPMPNVSVSIAAKDDGLSITSLLTPRAAVRTGTDGTFVIPAVAPGRYQLAARVAAAPAARGIGAADPVRPAVRTMAAAGGTGDANAGDVWASQEVIVDGREMTNVTLTMQPGMTVSGRLVFEASTRPAPAPADLTRARVTLTPVSTGGAADAIASGAASISVSVSADGTFAVGGLSPNSYRVTVAMPGIRTSASAPGDGWSLRSIVAGAQDVADRALEIRPREDVADVLVRLTDRPTEIRGTLSDQADRPAPGFPIVIFSTTRADWAPGSRRVSVARPSTDGTFRLVGLPPGAYFLCAVVSLDQSDLDDPSFLEQLAASALTITLTEGATLRQDLRVGGV